MSRLVKLSTTLESCKPAAIKRAMAAFRAEWTLVLLLAVVLSVALASCASTVGARGYGVGYQQKGYASWYGPGFHGKTAANGETYNQNALTAAHKKLPFETMVEVTRRDTGARVIVRITDRGPFVRGRIIDLSKEAARRLDSIGDGVVPVRIRVISAPGRAPRGSSLSRATGFAVQLGAFTDVAGAEAARQRLGRRIPGLRVVTSANPSGSIRLLTRRYSHYERVSRVARNIRRDLLREAFIVSDPAP